MRSREEALALDQQDPLKEFRDLFVLPPGLIYFDGNSLGALPKRTAEQVAHVVNHEWGQELIRAWNSAGWFTLPQRLGGMIAPLIGAKPSEVVVTDSTSVNLYKVLHVAMSIALENDPNRRVVLTERSNFPTDIYIAEGLCRERGFELRLVDASALREALDASVAVLVLTHVNYRTGAMFPLSDISRAAKAAGALMIWDLAHSAGAVPIDLSAADADFAVGCGYKYLNGGPGAPAFVWVHARHVDRAWQPLNGWIGHRAPFEFTPDYQPQVGINRYLAGTPPIISMAALACGLELFERLQARGGITALRQKSVALTTAFIEQVEARCPGFGLQLISPREPELRGSQVCFSHPTHSYAIMQALIARGVIGDYRKGDANTPDILRFGFAPLYNGFVEVWDAVEQLNQVLCSSEWKQPQFQQRALVT